VLFTKPSIPPGPIRQLNRRTGGDYAGPRQQVKACQQPPRVDCIWAIIAVNPAGRIGII
jgi:hypothetical protein